MEKARKIVGIVRSASGDKRITVNVFKKIAYDAKSVLVELLLAEEITSDVFSKYAIEIENLLSQKIKSVDLDESLRMETISAYLKNRDDLKEVFMKDYNRLFSIMTDAFKVLKANANAVFGKHSIQEACSMLFMDLSSSIHSAYNEGLISDHEASSMLRKVRNTVGRSLGFRYDFE